VQASLSRGSPYADAQRIRNLMGGNSLEVQAFLAAGLTGEKGDLSLRDMERFREEFNEGTVGFAIHRWGLEADFQGVTIQALNLAFGGPGAGMYLNNRAPLAIGNPTHADIVPREPGYGKWIFSCRNILKKIFIMSNFRPMNENKMTVVQCWDDGVTADVRLIEILRKHHAKATFNLNAGLYEAKRKPSWVFQGTEVGRLGWDEMKDLYQGFTIANHSLSHPFLEKLPVDAARKDIEEGRCRLQQFFGQPVLGFAYPYGTYSEAVMEAVRAAGHVYARTTRNVAQPFPPENAMAFHPCCHFLAPDFWQRYQVAKAGGVFYFWGHSYEMITETMWSEFDAMIERISADSGSCWGDVVDLF